jgi:hypothetical protein
VTGSDSDDELNNLGGGGGVDQSMLGGGGLDVSQDYGVMPGGPGDETELIFEGTEDFNMTHQKNLGGTTMNQSESNKQSSQ